MIHDVLDERLHPVICEDNLKYYHNDSNDHLNVYPHEQFVADNIFEDQSLTEKTIFEDLIVDEEELLVSIDAFGIVSNVSYGQNSKDYQASHMHSFFHYGRETKVYELRILGNLSDQPTFDEYPDGEE